MQYTHSQTQVDKRPNQFSDAELHGPLGLRTSGFITSQIHTRPLGALSLIRHLADRVNVLLSLEACNFDQVSAQVIQPNGIILTKLGQLLPRLDNQSGLDLQCQSGYETHPPYLLVCPQCLPCPDPACKSDRQTSDQ